MIYFDNAATAFYKPECVIKASDYALKKLCANAGRGSHAPSVKAASLVYEARKAVKKLTSCDEAIFTFNCTDALNTVLFGTARRGGHVVTTVFEHNSVLRPLTRLSDTLSVTYTAVPPDDSGTINPDDIAAAIRPNTYLIAVNHVSNVTGTVAPTKKIGAIAKRNGLLFLVDGAQSVGYIDTDMRDMGCDFLCFAPHKGLHGPQGVGVLCITGAPKITPLRYGGTGTQSHSLVQPDDIPEGLESGTLPVHSLFALIAAISHSLALKNSDRKRLGDLGEKLRRGLEKIKGVTLYGKTNALPNIAAFNIAGMNSSTVGNILSEQYDIAVRCGLQCAPLCHEYLGTSDRGVVRASLSYGNTEKEVDFFLSAVAEIANGAGD